MEIEIEKLDDTTVWTIGASNFSISISFSLTKSLIQTQPEELEIAATYS